MIIPFQQGVCHHNNIIILTMVMYIATSCSRMPVQILYDIRVSTKLMVVGASQIHFNHQKVKLRFTISGIVRVGFSYSQV